MVIWDIIFCFIVCIYCYFFIIHKIVVKLVIRFCYFTLIDIYSIYYFLLFVVICSFIFNFSGLSVRSLQDWLQNFIID